MPHCDLLERVLPPHPPKPSVRSRYSASRRGTQGLTRQSDKTSEASTPGQPAMSREEDDECDWQHMVACGTAVRGVDRHRRAGARGRRSSGGTGSRTRTEQTAAGSAIRRSAPTSAASFGRDGDFDGRRQEQSVQPAGQPVQRPHRHPQLRADRRRMARSFRSATPRPASATRTPGASTCRSCVRGSRPTSSSPATCRCRPRAR